MTLHLGKTLVNALARRWWAHPGRISRLLATPLFDALWYLRRYPDLDPDLHLTPAEAARHYLRHGAAEGRDPGPAFSTSGYWAQVRAAGLSLGSENPLLHYLEAGQKLGLAALPSFAGARPRTGAPVILFAGHQAQTHVFGAEHSLLHMLDRADRAGLAVEVVLPQALNPDYLAQVLARAQRVHLRPYGWRRSRHPADSASVAQLAALIAQTGVVALHQNTAVLDAPLIAARAAGLPTVVYLRELPAQDPELCARLGLTAADLRVDLLAQADRFIANSAAVARWIDAPPGACLIWPNSIEASLFDLAFHPQTPLRVGLISSNMAKKGLADFLTLARLCATRYPTNSPFCFVLIGPHSADLARLSPLPALVRQAGYAAGAGAALAQLDVVLSLSGFAESFGRTVYEALAAGRPVICYDRGTPPDLIGAADHLAGQIVPCDDPAAVLTALEKLLHADHALHAASQAARARARQIRQMADAVRDAQLYGPVLHRSDHTQPQRQ